MKYTFAVLAGLVVLATGAGAQQTVTVDAEVTDVNAPDELPGTYRLALEIETDPQGPTCACQTTDVYLDVANPEATELWRYRPVGYTIQWDKRLLDPETEDEHVRHGHVVVEAGESLRDAADRTVKITVDARHDGPTDGEAADAEVQHARVQLSPPEDGGSEGSALAASQGGSGPSEGAQAVPHGTSTTPVLLGAGLLTLVASAGAVARLH